MHSVHDLGVKAVRCRNNRNTKQSFDLRCIFCYVSFDHWAKVIHVDTAIARINIDKATSQAILSENINR